MKTNKIELIKDIVDAQNWENFEYEEGDDAHAEGKDYWDIAQVLYCKLDWLKESLQDLARENGDDFDELENHIETIDEVQYVLGLLNEKKLYALERRCAFCNEPMSVIVQGHHHTENGMDVTT